MSTTESVVISKAKGRKAPAHAPVAGFDRRVLRVWLVNDNAALRGLFAQLLTQQPSIRCRRQFPSVQAVLAALAEERPPDMILLDVHLGGQSGLSAIGPIRKLAPTVKVLMLAMFSSMHYEAEAFRAGASGFLLMSYELKEIVNLIHQAHRNPGAPGLFPNMALQKEAELDAEGAGARRSGGRFSLFGSLRQLCGAPRRQTAG
jgi:DNA-binding NarL/FixJ family response regulator